MNIQQGDWVVLTGEKLGDRRYEIIQLKPGFIILDEPGYEVQRIQDYFEPGDKVEIISCCDDKAKGIIAIIDSQSLDINFGEGLRKASNWPFEVCKSIRNLTKEGKISKEKPTHLTDKDLVALDTKACKEGKDSFYKEFGSEVKLTDSRFKTFLKEYGLIDYVKKHLPDHYAVIFEPKWKPKKGEIVWLDGHPNSIGRIWEKEPIHGYINVIDANGQINAFKVQDLRPISERDFQVGDYYWDNRLATYNVCLDSVGAELLNNNKDRYKLIISPTIPEVK